ncbi:hypothetical protein FHS70_000799 [Flammeovirga yaeyamensis]|nr:hypothetical protein [Flammeovirga yaeyamensis]
MKFIKIFFSILLIISFIITCQIDGWLLLIFGIFFGLTFLLQLKLIWIEDFTGIRILIIITYFSTLIMLLFRHDFGDSNVSGINVISLLTYKLGLIGSKYYVDNTTTFDMIINLMWVGIIPIQLFLLRKYYRIKTIKE